MRVLGFDPSLNNWGIASGHLDINTLKLDIFCLDVVDPILPSGKQVRQNSKDIEKAFQISQQIANYLTGVSALFVEVPVGSKSARAMASYGICVGILGAVKTRIPLYEVTPTEVKLAGAGTKTATKREMIAWAVDSYPDAPWPTYKQNGQQLITEGKAEHMADAIAAIHAGISLSTFKQALAMRVA